MIEMRKTQLKNRLLHRLGWPLTHTRRLGLACGLALLAATAALAAEAPGTGIKHVFLMVADGAGYNTWTAASMYQGRWDASAGKSTQAYEGPDWVGFGCSTYPLNIASTPTGSGLQEVGLIYDPAKAWDREQGYAWLQSGSTDSAAAATALSTATKTFNNAINWSDLDQPLGPTLAEMAKTAGKAVGVVTTVPWSHATPAGLANAHNVSRKNLAELANAMLAGEVMDVIMGAGNPDYDDNGAPREVPVDYQSVGGSDTWRAIEKARARPTGTYQGFRPLSTLAEFQALISGPTPRRVLGTAQVATTLQAARQGAQAGESGADSPRNPGVPDLVTLVRGALNVLDEDPDGLFLAIEGGAIDWANHQNNASRMIEEQLDFFAAMDTVIAWVEANSHWGESLLILTADHETGLLWGPQSDQVPFDPLVDQGAGRVPKLAFNATGHTTSLVPVYARGAGSEWLARFVIGDDPVRGPYVDNTGVSQVLRYAVAGPAPAIPAPATRGP